MLTFISDSSRFVNKENPGFALGEGLSCGLSGSVRQGTGKHRQTWEKKWHPQALA
jgi:hypothetical protein